MRLKRWLPYIDVLRVFAVRLVRLGMRVGRQCRPGNLLSSLFLLFSGLTEEVVSLRREVLQIPFALAVPVSVENIWRFSKRWIRLGVIVAGWVLFIMSSWEWRAPAPLPMREEVRITGETRVVKAVAVVQEKEEVRRESAVFGDVSLVAADVGISRRWLLFSTLRI